MVSVVFPLRRKAFFLQTFGYMEKM